MKAYVAYAANYDFGEEFFFHFRGPKEIPHGQTLEAREREDGTYFEEQGALAARTLVWLTTTAWQRGFLKEFERAMNDPLLETAETTEEFVGGALDSYEEEIVPVAARDTSLTPA